jgi:hypothetical protein
VLQRVGREWVARPRVRDAAKDAQAHSAGAAGQQSRYRAGMTVLSFPSATLPGRRGDERRASNARNLPRAALVSPHGRTFRHREGEEARAGTLSRRSPMTKSVCVPALAGILLLGACAENQAGEPVATRPATAAEVMIAAPAPGQLGPSSMPRA